MGVRAQNFAGNTILRPGVYSKSVFPADSNAAGLPRNIVVILGQALGGIPYNAASIDDADRVNVFQNTTDALNILRGGNGYYACEFFLTAHSDPNLNLPSEARFVRIDPAIQSTLILKDGAADNIIDMKSARYGAIANQLSIKVSAGATLGHKIEVKFQGQTVGVRDDVGYLYFDIQYVGAGSAAVMSVTATALTTTVTGGPGGESLNLLFTQFKTVKELVDYIDQLPGYTATLRGASDAASNTLDAVTGQDIMTTAYSLKAHVQAAIDFLNNETSGEVIATYVGTARDDIANLAAFTFFASGSEGTTTITDWTNAFALLERLNVNLILVASGDPAVHALAVDHCQRMSAVKGRRNRQWAAGATSGKTVAQMEAEMRALNDYRAEYGTTGVKRPDRANAGVLTTFPGFLSAAFVIGIKWPNATTISATYKQIKASGLDRNWTDTEVDKLLAVGGTIFAKTDDGTGFEVVHNPTTYQAVSESKILNLPSMVRTIDFITLDSQSQIKARLARMKEAPGSAQIGELQNFLQTQLLPGYRDQNLLTDDPNTGEPAFSNVTFAVNGDAFRFGFRGIVVAPLHYGFITQEFIVVGSLAVAA